MTKDKRNAEACRRWRARNLRRVQEYNKERYGRNRMEIIKRVRAWQEAHPGYHRQRDRTKAVDATRRWRAANPERAAELNRAAQARWRERQRAKNNGCDV